MPPQSHRSKTVATGVGPMIPLAIALLHNAVIPSGVAGPRANTEEVASVEPVACGDDIEDYLSCHSEYPTGCNSNGKYDAYLNLLKNQISWSDSQVQKWLTSLDDASVLENSIPAGLGKNNHAEYAEKLRALGEGKMYGVVGYLYGVKGEGKESSNCQLEAGDDNENVDFHIYVGFDSSIASRIRSKKTTAADKKQMNPKSLIVEMTPHYRGQFRPEWSLDAVRKQLGNQIRVTGQLMVDNEHYVKSQDCGRKDHTNTCWRGTVWELHPVTDFEVCGTQNCDENSSGWAPIAESQ